MVKITDILTLELVKTLAENGYVVVPLQPTTEMVLAAESAIEDHKDSTWDSGGDGESHNSYEYFTPGVEVAVWKAMIGAMPA